jgi:hypothetical protein
MVAPLSVVGIARYHRPAESYTTLRNDFVRDARVSLRAFRVGAYVLSHADGFIQTQAQIARAVGLSVTTVRAALEDLRRDRHLVSRRIRERGQWVGTAYAVSDVPFTDEELALLCPPGAESECSESEHAGSVPPKKTTPVRETMKDKKTNPPGDQAPPGSPEAQEEPMPRTTADSEPALFDLPADSEVLESHGRQGGKSATQCVVAAFVDSHRQQHGVDPTRSEIGRVARDVKRLIGNPSTEEQLLQAATAMGKTPFANIAVQLKKTRHPVAQMHKQQRHGADVWEEGAAEIERRAALRAAEDPAVAAWLAGEAVSA